MTDTGGSTSTTAAGRRRLSTAEEYLAVPLAFTVEPVEGSDGRWRFRASYLELPGCSAESPLLTEALGDLDRRRAVITIDLLARHETPPCPRPPVPFEIFAARKIIESVTASGGAG